MKLPNTLPLIVGAVLLLPQASIVSAAEPLADCAAISNAEARLACFDALVAQPEADTKDAATDTVPDAKPDTIPEINPDARPAVSTRATPETATEAGTLSSPAASQQVIPTTQPQEDFGITLFGKRASEIDKDVSITSRIKSVREASGGQRIMTLVNGQVWMEREPGRRRIDPDQDVEIIKRRWSYSMMLLEQKHRITVQRID